MRIAAAIAFLIACGPPPREVPVDGDGTPDGTSVPPDVAPSEACAAAVQQRSYIGCTYWPVDLQNAIEIAGPPQAGNDCSMYGTAAVMMMQMDVCENADGTFAGRCDPGGTCPGTAVCSMRDACGLDAQHSPFAIAVANTYSDDAEVTLSDASGKTATKTIAPGATAVFSPQALGFVDHSVEHPGIVANAYKLVSTRPVVAYQMNPLDDVGVFSNDASLLLPEQTFDTTYMDLSYPNNVRRPASSDWRGYMTLVGTTTTNVDVTAVVATLAGTLTIPAGETHSFTIHAYETLQLSALNGDISGTRVTSDQPIAAYAGHEAATIPDPFPFRGPCCADHLEEQLYPTTTWSNHYAIARGRERATQIHDLIRVIAQKPNTVVQITPDPGPLSQCGGQLLQAGKACDSFLSNDVEVHANQPVLVAHYMVSGGGIGPQSGDPGLAFVPPVAQFRKSYTIFVPQQYSANDITLVAPTGSQVLLDGADVSLLLAPFATMAFSASRIAITPGAHQIECPMTCSVEVSGWNTAVSYLYSGGLDLALIVL